MIRHFLNTYDWSRPELQAMLDRDPFKGIEVTKQTRLYVTLLAEKTTSTMKLPYASEDGRFRILSRSDREVYSEVINGGDVPWIRLGFGQVRLGPGSRLQITSLLDGATQTLDARAIAQWQHTSAYFNGAVVRLSLIAAGNSRDNEVEVDRLCAQLAVGTPGALLPAEGEQLLARARRDERAIGVERPECLGKAALLQHQIGADAAALEDGRLARLRGAVAPERQAGAHEPKPAGGQPGPAAAPARRGGADGGG